MRRVMFRCGVELLDGVGLEGCNTERCHHVTQFYLGSGIWRKNSAMSCGRLDGGDPQALIVQSLTLLSHGPFAAPQNIPQTSPHFVGPVTVRQPLREQYNAGSKQERDHNHAGFWRVLDLVKMI